VIETIEQMLKWDSQANFEVTFRNILLQSGVVQLLEEIVGILGHDYCE